MAMKQAHNARRDDLLCSLVLGGGEGWGEGNGKYRLSGMNEWKNISSAFPIS